MLVLYCTRFNGRERLLPLWWMVLWAAAWFVSADVLTRFLFGGLKPGFDLGSRFPWAVVILAIGSLPFALSRARVWSSPIRVLFLGAVDLAVLYACRAWLWPALAARIPVAGGWRGMLGVDLDGLMFKTYIVLDLLVGLTTSSAQLLPDLAAGRDRRRGASALIVGSALIPPGAFAFVVCWSTLAGLLAQDTARLRRRLLLLWFPAVVTAYAVFHGEEVWQSAVLFVLTLSFLRRRTVAQQPPASRFAPPRRRPAPAHRSSQLPWEPPSHPAIEWELDPRDVGLLGRGSVPVGPVADLRAQEEMIEHLLAGMQQPSAAVRLQAVVALGRLALERTVARLAAVAAGDADLTVRVAAVEALQHLPLDAARTALATLSQDPDPAVRWVVLDPALRAAPAPTIPARRPAASPGRSPLVEVIR